MPFATPLASRHSLSKASDPSIMIVPLAEKLMCWLPPTENWKALELAWAGVATATRAAVTARAEVADRAESARVRIMVSLQEEVVGPPSKGVLAPHLGPACKRLE